MANKNLFFSPQKKISVPVATARNEAGGLAYKMEDRHALAQYVVTGCLANTFYATAKTELKTLLALAAKVSDSYIAQLALYARENGYMKDTPAVLCAILANRNVDLLKQVFNRVMDNGKMVRNFVQVIRSGAVGRKSFGSSIKKMIQRWIENRSEEQLFRDSVGNDPSLADVIKMSHPSPSTPSREALYAYICGKKVVYSEKEMENIKLKDGRNYVTTILFKNLPECVQAFEIYKKNSLAGNATGDVPNVPFQLLTALNLGTKEWTSIAKNAPWQMTRMNLNTFERHGVFKDDALVKIVADRLANKELIAKSKCFPYQLLSAFKNVEGNVPSKIINALQDAVEHATENVPEVNGKVYICIDVSGSMHSSVTGARGTATSKVTCLDVASLMAASLARKNQDAEIIPFHTKVEPCQINSRDSIMTNATKLAGLPAGGTACGAPIKHLNDRNAKGDLIIMISDNESWADMQRGAGRGFNYGSYGGTSAQVEWTLFKNRNKNARFVAIDIQPNASVQVQEQKDVLNVGGFSDTVFDIVGAFAKGELENGHWVSLIESIPLNVSPLAEVAQAGAKKAIKKSNKKQPRKSDGRFAAKDNRKLS